MDLPETHNVACDWVWLLDNGGKPDLDQANRETWNRLNQEDYDNS